jgi:CheY-like chemotaxis protein
MDANHIGSFRLTRTPPTVLVIDDEPVMRKTARAALEKVGFAVEDAANGRDALSKLKQKTPDVVVVDALLPDLHGFQIVRQIRAAGGRMPIVAMSAYYCGPGWAADVKDSFGASAYLEKPFRMEQLVELCTRLHGGATFDEDPTGMSKLSAPAMDLARKGIEAFRRRDLPAAAESLRGALALEPGQPAVSGWLGVVYAAAGRDLEAVPLLERAGTVERPSWETLRNLALVCERSGFRRKALEAWARTLAVAPAGPARDEARERLAAA